MKIKDIQIKNYNIKLKRPYTVAYQTLDTVTNILVQITDEKGHIGHGVASPEPYVTGETKDSCLSNLQKQTQSDFWINQDLRNFYSITHELEKSLLSNPAARAAMDMALLDLIAQNLEYPLYKLLGAPDTLRPLPTSITIGIKNSLTEMIEEAEEYEERGFKILKIKLGKDVDKDIEFLLKLYEKIQLTTKIRVDMNQGYTLEQLKQFLTKCSNIPIEFVEQPFKADRLDLYQNLDHKIKKKIAIDESLLGIREALTILCPTPLSQIINIKLMKCGGPTSALEIARLAQLKNVDLMWGCMDESCISISAALHTALACPNTRYLDLDGNFDLEKDIATGGFKLEKGRILPLTHRSGLGVTLN